MLHERRRLQQERTFSEVEDRKPKAATAELVKRHGMSGASGEANLKEQFPYLILLTTLQHHENIQFPLSLSGKIYTEAAATAGSQHGRSLLA